MRASRLLSILILLQLRGRMSAAALAREFEVSVRTIHRDIDELSAAGVPVYAERGRSGGFALHEGYRTQLTGFTAAEAELLLLAGLGSIASDLGVGPELAAAQLKLAASLPPAAGSRAKQISDRVHLDPVDWYRRPDEVSALPAVAAAVWRERRMRVTYESWRGIVARTLEPLGLVLKAGAWYAVAAANGAPRIYRVSNIKTFDLLDEAFARPRRFDLRRFWEARSREFEASLLKEKAHVRLTPRGAGLLRHVSLAAADAVETQRPRARSGWMEAEIPIESVEHAVGQLLRLGAEIEVLTPAALRERLAREGQALAEIYRSLPAAARSEPSSAHRKARQARRRRNG